MRKKLIVLILMGILGLMLPFWASAQQLTYENSQVPVIHPRSAWETPGLKKIFDWFPGEKEEEDKMPPPPYNPVQRIVIHHTGGDVAGKDKLKVIREIFKYHSLTRGWGDIGYHFIVAQDGSIYEGRYGGNGVRGAHLFYDKKCENYNAGSIGIAVLGDFREKDTSDRVYQSLSRLVAWLGAANDLDIGGMDKETEVWEYPIKDSASKDTDKRCDLTKGGFDDTFEGPVVLGHNDVEKSTECPGQLSIERIRNQAEGMGADFNSYLYTAAGAEDSYWSLQKESGGSYRTKTGSKMGRKVISINSSQLAYFPRAEKPNVSTGALVRDKDMERTYVIQHKEGDEIKRPILTPDLVREKGWDKKEVKVLPPRELAYFVTGDPVLYSEGSLLRAKESPEVYLIKDEKKHHITAFKLFSRKGWDPANIQEVPSEVVEAHPDGDPILFEDGTLVRGSSPMVYKIKDKKLHPINSLTLFEALGLDWSKVVELEEEQLTFYEKSWPVLYPDGLFLRDRLTDKVFLIKNGYKNWIKNNDAFKELGGQWGAVNDLAHSFLNFYPEGVTLTGKADLQEVSKLPEAEVNVSEQEHTKEPSEVEEEKEGKPETTNQEDSGRKDLDSLDLSAQKIKVGLEKIPAGKLVKITADSSYNVYKQGSFAAKKSPHTTYEVQAEPGVHWKFSAPGKELVFEILTYEDHPAWKASLNDNKFQGAIEVKCPQEESCWIINTLPVEDYLLGIAEALNNDSLEFLKAVAVAARSYAFHYVVEEAKHPDLGFDLTNKATDQLYKGYGYHTRAPRVAKAVKETEGEILTYQGNIVIPAYCSDSGGTSKDACKVWGGKYCREEFAYLRGGVEDPEGASHNQAKMKASHGVGMSNTGAREMAETGTNYKQILRHYFPGTEMYDYSP